MHFSDKLTDPPIIPSIASPAPNDEDGKGFSVYNASSHGYVHLSYFCPMQSLLTDKLPELRRILQRHKVKRAYAFGSVCTDEFNPQSDIDLLVKFEEGIGPVEYSDNYFNLLFSLQDFFKRDVDLVTEPSLKNPYFIQSLNRTKQPIYE